MFEILYYFDKSPKKGIGRLNKNFHLYCQFRELYAQIRLLTENSRLLNTAREIDKLL